MMQIVLIGIGAGAAAGLLFASVTSGSLLAVLLFYLAPLPILIAALGWSHWSALIAALVGAVSLASIFGWVFFVAFIATAGLPAWWLGYLTMLARPVGGNGQAPAVEWYPPGRLVAWAAMVAGGVVMVAILNFGIDAESFRTNLTNALSRILRADDSGTPNENAKRLIEFLVIAVPPAAAVLATLTNVFNLWLAGVVVRFSSRLTRPWPDIPGMTFPRLLAGALGAALALSFLGGMLGIVASVVGAALLTAYGVLGFAVLHTVTRGMGARGLLLGGVYAAVVVLGWPMLVLSLLGLLEGTINLRARVARTRGPPPPAPM
jgi:hypothetical protein